MSEDAKDPTAQGAYRIAAVSQFVGMPIPTIRMWERRYGAVTPARSAGNGRLYSREDVERLLLLKSAVDAGHAIGTVAPLSNEQVRARLEALPKAGWSASTAPCRVMVSGHALAERLRLAWEGREDVGVVRELPRLADIPDEPVAGEVDALIIDVPTLQASAMRQLRQLKANCPALVVIAVFGFAARQTLQRLDEIGVLAVAMPADPAHLARICHLGTASRGASRAGVDQLLMRPIATRRFDDAFLATVAREPTTVQCECPNHLADLLVKLNAFEQYSRECENNSPTDASIHVLLHAAAAHCREVLEHGLQQVLIHEGRMPRA